MMATSRQRRHGVSARSCPDLPGGARHRCGAHEDDQLRQGTTGGGGQRWNRLVAESARSWSPS